MLDGPAALVEAEAHRIGVIAGERNGVPAPAVAAAPAYAWERAVTLGALEASIEAGTTHLVGWHGGGAALVDSTRAPVVARERSAPSPLRVALKAQLDPEGRLPAA
jgi:hypothetical protein